MAFVVSRGQLAALEPRTMDSWWANFDRSARVGPELALTYSQIYRSQPAVRTVVDFLARNISSLPLHVFERVSDTDRRRLTADESPLARLLGRPAPTRTALRFWHSIVADKAIFDCAYAIKLRAGGDQGPLVGLRRVPVRRISPVDGDWLDAEKYKITGTVKTIEVPRERLVVFEGYDPDHEAAAAQSPIETLRMILAEEYAAAVYRAQLWANGARAAGYIERPAEAPEWSRTEKNRFREDWRSQWSGSATTAGGTPILEDGMRWVKSAISPKEAQYVESRKLTREEVATAYHIPPPMVGILDNATYSNITEQHKQLYVDTLGPWLEALQQEVELQVVPEFAGNGGPVYVEFHLASKLNGSFEEQADAVAKATGGRPWMTPDEARGRFNLSAIGGSADELLDPLNMGDASGGDEQVEGEPDAEPGTSSRTGTSVKSRPTAKGYAGDVAFDTHHEVVLAHFERQERSVRSRAGAAKRAGRKQTVEEVLDVDRWSRELARDLEALAGPTVNEVAAQTLDDIGATPGSFVPELTAAFLASQAARVAGSVTTVTAAAVAGALAAEVIDEALEGVYALARSQRAPQIARTQVTALSGFGTYEVGRQLAESGEDVVKQWVTGKNPRPSHAAMNGQSVPVDSKFSNGAMWPADTVNLDVDEVAGCNCALVIALEGSEDE